MEALNTVLVPIHPAGWVFIAAFAFATLILGAFWEPFFFIGFMATLWCVYFFRDPVRVVPTREGLIVSPADGMVQRITRVVPPAELDLGTSELTRVSIFLNVFDVHVNRIPINGRISKLFYFKGTFINASLDKASTDNERQLIKITGDDGKEYGVVQIAGLVARRIICDLQEGQTVKTGMRFGMIRFGSRTDIYLPEGVNPLVIEGQKMLGGESIIADTRSTEPARQGMRQ